MRVNQVRMLVSDFDSCFRFYRDIMGFKPQWGEEGGTYAYFMVSNETGFALFRRDLMAEAIGTADLPAKADCQDVVALVFEGDDLEKTLADLKSKGVRLVSDLQDYPDWTIRAAHFRDPDGNLIELCGPLDRSKWTDRVVKQAEKYNKIYGASA